MCPVSCGGRVAPLLPSASGMIYGAPGPAALSTGSPGVEEES